MVLNRKATSQRVTRAGAVKDLLTGNNRYCLRRPAVWPLILGSAAGLAVTPTAGEGCGVAC